MGLVSLCGQLGADIHFLTVVFTTERNAGGLVHSHDLSTEGQGKGKALGHLSIGSGRFPTVGRSLPK